MARNFIITSFLFLLFSCLGFSQELNTQQKQKLIEAAHWYKKGEYSKAELQFRETLNEKMPFNHLYYNLSNCLFRLQKYKESIEGYETYIQLNKSRFDQSKAFYNMGNAYLIQNELEKAIENYKKCLIINSFDEDARYNLSYALRIQQQSKKEKQNENENENEKEKEKEKEKENENKNEKEKENENENEKNENKNQKEQDKEGNRHNNESKKSKEEAKKILETLNAQEKKIQEKMNKEKLNGNISTKKDW